MQLNNINGKSIKLDKIDINQNRVVYSIYEYGTGQVLEQKSYNFTTIQLKDYLTESTNYETLCYNTLVVEVEFDYVNSNDPQNWTILTGSTGANTVLRVYIPSKVLNEVMNSGNPLDLLIKQMENSIAQIQRLYLGSHQYLLYLDDTARTILEEYSDIVIENKI